MTIPEDQIWIIVVGFIISFILAFGIGANDVANSFGTSVGSRVLTLKQACILGTIFETLGSVLIGAKVSDTIRKGVLSPEVYSSNFTNGPEIIMLGQLASLSGACIWLLLATFFKLPVSGSHSIVGAIIGFALIAQGTKGINWLRLVLIVSSWFISPLLSGTVSVLSFMLVDRFILKKENPLEPGLSFLPYIYSLAIVTNVFSILISGPPLLHFNKIPLYGVFIVSIGAAIITILVVRYLAVPYLRRRISEKCNNRRSSNSTPLNIISLKVPAGNGFVEEEMLNKSETNSKVVTIIKDKPEQDALFSWLQILTAIFGSFAHGGNDVSNAIGPLVGLWIIGWTQDIGSSMETPIWILFYGGVGISVGLWIWGRRVIKTMGNELTTITPSSGVCIEIGAAMTVLLASNAGIPISTTHCKVGSIVAVGRYRAKGNVDWSIFRNIVIAWAVTVPLSGGLSALIMFVLIQFA